MTRWFSSFALMFLVLLGAGRARAQRALLPPELIALDSPEGEKLLVEASAKEDFFHLTSTYVSQQRPSFCGVASAVMVLNALPIVAPPAEPGAAFTQENFFNDAARKVHPAESVAKGGMTIDQLGELLRCHPTQPEVVHATDSSLEAFRATASKNLATVGDYVIVNYLRSEVGQEYMGHISPLGAYNEKADRFLLLDVARYKYPPVWVAADALFRAMSTKDLSSGASRGWVAVRAAANAPGPAGAKKPRSPLMMLAVIVSASFVVGLGVGLLIGSRRARRKQTEAPTAT